MFEGNFYMKEENKDLGTLQKYTSSNQNRLSN